MTPDCFPDISIVHLSVDPQDSFIKDLAESRKTSFPASLREFADAILPIPTIWVMFGYGFKSYSRSITNRQQPFEIADKYGLTPGLMPHEDIYEKNDDNAFEDLKLMVFLKKKYPNLKQLVITGMNTRFCVAATIIGATAHGLTGWAIYDLMADCRYGSRDGQPDWHGRKLKEHLDSKSCDGFLIRNKQTFLEYLKLNPNGLGKEAHTGSSIPHLAATESAAEKIARATQLLDNPHRDEAWRYPLSEAFRLDWMQTLDATMRAIKSDAILPVQKTRLNDFLSRRLREINKTEDPELVEEIFRLASRHLDERGCLGGKPIKLLNGALAL